MKVNIVKDKSGKAIATFQKAQGDQPSVVPELDSSHSVHEIEVEANYLQNLDALYKLHSK